MRWGLTPFVVVGAPNDPMDPYTFSLTLGGVGLGVMALSGVAHAAHSAHGHTAHGHAHGVHGHSHAGHGHSHAHDASAHAQHAHHTSHAPHESGSGQLAPRVLALLSPRVAFSVLVGVGAAGVLLRPVLSEPALLIASLGAGLVFEWMIVSPLW